MFQKTDKILNNSFSSGELHYEDLSKELKIDSRVAGLYEDQLGDDIVDHRTKKMLDDEIYKIFLDSPYYKKYKTPKRVDKNDMMKMYYYFKDEIAKLENKHFSNMEVFVGFAEFFQVNYDQLYADIGVMDKEFILKELNEKYSLTNKIKTKRLF
jgi:hypothetical protein